MLKRSADWQDGRKACNNVSSQRADDELEGEIKDALTRFPSFGYKRVTLWLIASDAGKKSPLSMLSVSIVSLENDSC